MEDEYSQISEVLQKKSQEMEGALRQKQEERLEMQRQLSVFRKAEEENERVREQLNGKVA